MKVDGVEIVIESDASKACKELDRMIAKLGDVNAKIRSTGRINIGGKGGTSGATSGLKTYSTTASRAAKSTFSLASAFGKFYASCFLFIRGVKAIGKSIESSMDYIETYNYYNVIMDKIGTEFGDAWKENGYNSADEYAKSFKQRLNDLTGEMTGYKIGSEGGLYATDSIGLGLDPEKIMSYQASIASITNAVGLAGETSINTAKAMSMLAADMSSLKNVDLETVMTNLQSGLIGQSRALYKYGIDITNNTLAEYALANGIKKKVSEMTQAEKMQLRMLAILGQSKVAYGDMANTINGVANQYRIFKQQVSNLARIIGNLFIPVLQAVLPYVNGFVIALQRLFTWLGNLMGVKWDGLMDGISSGYNDTGLDALGDSADDTTDALDAADKAAKKLKATIHGYDELHVATDPTSGKDDTGSGSSFDLSGAIGDALGDYQSVWDEAMKNMENKAIQFADYLTDIFRNKKYFQFGQSIGDAIKDSLESIDWQNVFNAAYAFGVHLADFLNGLISPELFSDVGMTIANSLNTAIKAALGFGKEFDFENLGESIAAGINTFFTTFDFKSLAETMNTFADGILTTLRTAISKITWTDVIGGIDDFLGELKLSTVSLILGGIALKYLGQVLTSSLFKQVLLEKIFGTTAMSTAGQITWNVGSKLIIAFAATAITFGVFETFVYEPLMESMLKDAENADEVIEKYRGADGMLLAFKNTAEGVKNFLATGIFQYGANDVQAYEEAINQISFDGVFPDDDKLKKMQEAFGFTDEQILALKNTMMDTHPELKKLQEQFSELGNASPQTLQQIADGMVQIEGSISPAKDEATKFLQTNKDLTDEAKAFFEGISTGTTDVDDFKSALESAGIKIDESFIKKMSNAIENMRPFKQAWQEDIVTPISEWCDEFALNWDKKVAKPFSEWVDGIKKYYDEKIAPIFSSDKWSFSGIKDGLSQAFESAIVGIKVLWNNFANWLNSMLKFDIGEIKNPFTGSTISKGFSIDLGKLPTFATGGFPEDGLFMANRNELVGNFSNGKTAVANNAQITDGIEAAVTNAMMNVFMATSGNDSNSDDKEIHLHVHFGDSEIGVATYKGLKSASRQGLIPKMI